MSLTSPYRVCILYFVVLDTIVFVCSLETALVETPFGKIQGARKTDENTGLSYLSFKGIPYAKPPVENLRFAKPEPHPNIEGVFDATRDDLIVCPHLDTMTFGMTGFTEDCLILNIQMKDSPTSDSLKKVIVYIHGGGFQIGTSIIQDSTSFVISQDVIVVTVNYRLGVLGFLSMENEASPGNYGLWDQTLAIKWVKDNIRAFGGDPDDITIAGESAGGAAVGYQILSPRAKGLFTKAYPMSGMATSIFALSINATSHALEFARSVGCWDAFSPNIDIQQTVDVIQCLRNIPLSNITFFATSEVSKTKFVPCVDGDFVPSKPAKLLKDDRYLDSIGFFDRSYMTSVVNNEASLIDGFMTMTKTVLSMSNDMSQGEKEAAFRKFQSECKNLQMSRMGEPATRDPNIVNEIFHFYDERYNNVNILSELMVDLNMLIPSLDLLMAASRRESTSSYFLYLNHFPRFVTGPRKGIPHEADLAFWFEFDLDFVELLVNAGIKPGLFDEDDIQYKKMFSAIVGEFARSGLAINKLGKLTI